ncbi:MAG: hypothetical protein IJM90_06470 [Firmicutes bacterium]|nr:hypothetical protein [Bacillota bacterium]
MRKRRLSVLTAYLLAATMLLTACDGGQKTSVPDESRSAQTSQTSKAEESKTISAPEDSSKAESSAAESSAGKPPKPPKPEQSAAESSAEESSEPEPDLWPDAVDFSELETSYSPIHYASWTPGLLEPGLIPVMVVVVTFTDGYQIDKEVFENQMEGQQDLDNCIRSVGSYYRYTSYKRVLLDFQYIYYDSGMTCSEAWHYVNDEDSHGHFKGNGFIKEIFDDIRSRPGDFGIEDFSSLDGNGDGFVDLPIFMFAEDSSKTYEGERRVIYGAARGSFVNDNPPADVNNPNLKYFIKTPYETLLTPPDIDINRTSSGVRTVIHEIGHMFGVEDYYDFHSYNGEVIDVMGTFDMQSSDIGDWNTFSKFSVGFLDPYVIDDLEDSITIRLGCSIEKNQAILIPTSAGWNGTPFDEYILVDVIAPVGATGFDWGYIHRQWDDYTERTNKDGGVRILHVDARLALTRYAEGKSYFLDPWEATYYGTSDEWVQVHTAFWSTNYAENVYSGQTQSRYFHIVEMVPSDGSSCYRICTPPFPVWSAFHFFTSSDLFGPGDVFSMETCQGAFAAYPKMNNGSDLDYSVTVEAYDPVKHEAIVTITRIR